MTDIATTKQYSSVITPNHLMKAIMLLLLWAIGVNAQQELLNITHGMMPPAVAPGSPVGSYALSGFDNISLYSGQINFRLPLLQVGARGGAGYTMMLNFDQRWRVRTDRDTDPIQYFLWPEANWLGPLPPGYGPGTLVPNRVGDLLTCAPFRSWSRTLTRLTFTAPDGTHHVLRDTLTNGKPLNTSCTQTTPFSRGTVFTSADGEAMTFVADSAMYDSLDGTVPIGPVFPSGMLYFRDGARYRIDSGTVTWIQDRNGNRVSFTYDASKRVTQIMDSINRVITISYANMINVFFDQITFKGAGGALRTIRVWYANLGQVLRSGYALGTERTLFPELNDGLDVTYDPTKVSMVELPDGRSYKLYYNPYAELARVELPTGGAYEYDYNQGSGCINPAGSISNAILRRVKKRRVYPDGVNPEGETVYNETINGAAQEVHVEVDKYDRPGGILLEREKHYFYGDPIFTFFGTLPIDYPSWKEGREYQVERYAVINGVVGPVLRRTVMAWAQRAHVSWYPLPFCGGGRFCTPDYEPGVDPRVLETVATLADANLVSKRTFGYDQYNNRTDVYDYDFGPGVPGPLVRRTHTDYVTLNNGVDYAADANIHIRNLPLQTQVFDAGGTKRAETFYEYDNYNSDGLHAPLTDRPNISGHDGAFWAGYLMRGNVTKTSRALLNNNGGVTGWVNSHAQYDIAGNVVKVIDSNGNPTQFDLRDNFGSPDDPEVQSSDNPANNAPGELGGQVSYAFPFKITSALEHKAYTKYDYYLGRPALSEDANGGKSNTYFNDALDRPTRGVRAIGTSVASQTVLVYNDSGSPVNGYPAHSITTISDKDVFGESNSGNGLKSVALYDGLGRAWRSAAYEGPTWTINDMQFDALGRVSQVSNPYRAADPGSASPPANLWTTTGYDELGRPTKVTTPDGAHVDTAYNGNQVTVTDQAGKKRRSKTDALGRLVEVIEDPDGVAYHTDYSYDTLGNLTIVNQGGQFRYFFYDSLGRLTRAKNPEQNANSLLNLASPPAYNNNWSTAYSYSANGNLASKTDARNITTTYGYDALNRNTTVSYSDSTPGVTITYDTATLGKGRLQKTETAGGMGSRVTINAYDAMGRPLSQSQQFFYLGAWGTPYTMEQTYDLAGNVKTMKYPSLRTVNYSYDIAGRLSSFSGNLGGSPRAYADTIGYNAAGQVIKERFGTDTSLYHNLHYNNRMQLVDTRVGDSATDEWNWSRGAISFLYGTTAVASGDKFANDMDNNGNLRRQIASVPLAGGGYVIPQVDDYTYDALNRISSFTDSQVDSGGQWMQTASQNYSYDPYGNRRITSATGGVSNYNPTYDLGSNRIVGPSYDQAGNITSDVLTGGTMAYDAENRLRTASAGGGGTYTYDANGKRTRRAAGGKEIWHIYGIVGELLAEYAANGAPSAPQKEYGYRGGQILVIAESGSGGGVSLVKPDSQSSPDLIGKIGLGAGAAANRSFSADEHFINNGYGSITADSSDSENAGRPVRGGPRASGVEYDNAQSANGVGELLAERPAGAAPRAPQKEFGARRGLSIVTAQSVSSVSPGAYQTPDPGQYESAVAVSNATNIGHGDTHVYGAGDNIEEKSCIWHGFQFGGQALSITLKVDWNESGILYGLGYNEFKLEYSLDGGANWNVAFDHLQIRSSSSGTFQISLPPSQNISQVRVRDYLEASASETPYAGELTASISYIRLEIQTDTTAPVISNVAAGGITAGGATITWNTNENSDSQVEYGTTTAYGQSTTLNPALVTAHSQGLSGLTGGTLYHYRVKSRDAAGNLAVSGDFTFSTTDITAPVISNVAAGGITAGGATITWNTNENSDSQVEYGTTTAYGQSTTLNPALVTAHSQGLSGLTGGTLYHYRVKSRDAAGNLAVSGDFTFTTAPDTTPPTVTSFFPAAGATNVNANANVTVTFSEAINAATVNGSTIELRDPSNALAPATVSYNAASLTATLDPTASLAAGVTYTARVRGGSTDPRVKDVAGNAMAADVTWSFTTAQNGSGGIKWLVTDHLGSTRMVIDETGGLAGIKRHGFAPFGEELSTDVGVRNPSNGYSSDSVRQKFTGSERDPETGLDLMGARYSSSLQGRFISVDPLLASGRPANPQSWNRYSYVLNRPLTLTDPSGMDPAADRPNEEKRKQKEQQKREEEAQKQQPQPTPPPPVAEGEIYYNPVGDDTGEGVVTVNMGETKANEAPSASVFDDPRFRSNPRGYVLTGQLPRWELYNNPTIRFPDAISLSVSTSLSNQLGDCGTGMSFTLTRDGKLYESLDLSQDFTTRWQPTIGANLNFIWLNTLNTPTSRQMGNFFPGSSFGGYIGTYWVGGGMTYVRGAGTATVIGFSTPTANLTYSGAVPIADTRLRW